MQTAPADRHAAIETLRDLMRQGFAGVDQYDDTRFVVDAPEPFLTAGEDALDDLGGYFVTTSQLGEKPSHVAALLPGRVRNELGLDGPLVPAIVVPLASRRVVA